MKPLVLAVNVLGGLVLAVFLGASLALARRELARDAARSTLGAFAGALALAWLVGARVHPVAALAGVAFWSAAWAAAPLDAPQASTRARLAALGAGGGSAVGVAAFSHWDLWWLVPLLGLAGAILVSAWQARPVLVDRALARARDALPLARRERVGTREELARMRRVPVEQVDAHPEDPPDAGRPP